MARFVTSPLIAAISGTLAGATFKNSRSGPVAAKRYRARRARSASQGQGVAAICQLAYRWGHTLTQTQRDAWDRASRPGEPARQAYTSENAIRLRAQLELIDTAPPWPRQLPPPALSISWTDPAQIVIGPPGDLPGADEHFILSLLHPWTPSVLAPRTWAKQSWTLTGPLTGAQTLALDTPLYPGLHTRLVARRIQAYSAQEIRTVKFYDELTPAIGYFNIIDIPDSHNHMSLIISARSTKAAAYQTTRLYLNDDLTETNYWTDRHISGTVHESVTYNYPYPVPLPAAQAAENLRTQLLISIPLYSSDRRKILHFRAHWSYTQTATYTYLGAIRYDSTAPVSRIRFAGTAPDLVLDANSRCQLYLHDQIIPPTAGRASYPAQFPLLWPE